jgi:uncharacterized delta-60 repeat protein
VALQPDGKIVVAGSSDAMTLARYETDGSLDRNFGSGGIAKAPGLSADSVALEPDGWIIAAGGSGSSLAVGRFLSDGRLDPSFGSGGAMTAHAGGLGGASDVAVQADGRIVVAASGANLVTLARIRADGSLDSDFGEDGISQMAFGSWSQAIAVAVEPDGRILAAGFTDTNFLLARFRVTTPTTIGANLTTVPYGREFALHGTAAEPRPGDPVQVLTRACQSRATTRPGSTREEAGGTWAARVRPRVTASYRAEIAGERSVSITVQVSPRMMIRRLSHSRVQVRVLYGRALTGEVITLQRNRRTGWNTIATAGLQRIGRTRHGVLSGITFKAKARGGQLHAVLGQPNPYSCFAGAMSRTLPR